jgi:hypothetical protein
MTLGNQLSNIQGGLGQALGQGYANIGNIQAQQAMGPTNMLASALGQGAQLAALYAGGGMGGSAAGRASPFSSVFGSAFPSSYNMSLYSPHR